MMTGIRDQESGVSGQGLAVNGQRSAIDTGAADPGDALTLLSNLVAIQSVSGDEALAVAYLVDWMQARGFRAFRDEAGNAVGILEAPNTQYLIPNTKDIVLLGHIDTVPGFPAVGIRDGKLYGRGAVDAKGPLAAFAAAAAAVGPRPGWRIIVVGAVEEESTTSKGARHIARTYNPSLAVIGEPTGWQRVALGYKGRLLADLTVSRPMAHRAGPAATAPELAVGFWNRVSARVGEMNAGREKVWDQLQANLRYFCSDDDGLTETAQMVLGFRLPLDVNPGELRSLLTSLDGHGELSFSGDEHAYRADKNTPLVRAFLAAVREAGGQPSFVYKTGTSDMNVVGPIWRCPLLAYGPGDSSLDHTPGEHVEVAEWARGVGVLADVLRQITDPRTTPEAYPARS